VISAKNYFCQQIVASLFPYRNSRIFSYVLTKRAPWRNCCLQLQAGSHGSRWRCATTEFRFLVVIGFQSFSNLQFDTCLSLAILSMLSEAWVNIH